MKETVDDYDYLVVQSAGNSKIDAKYNGLFCSIDDPEYKERIVIAGAIELNDEAGGSSDYVKADYSNFGSTIDVMAPGSDIQHILL